MSKKAAYANVVWRGTAPYFWREQGSGYAGLMQMMTIWLYHFKRNQKNPYSMTLFSYKALVRIDFIQVLLCGQLSVLE